MTETDIPRSAAPEELTQATSGLPQTLQGSLHAYFAFDWGEEVDLVRAQSIFSARSHSLPRVCPTPSSIAYRPPPLRFALENVMVELPVIGRQESTAEAIVFDFAAASVALHIPFTLTPCELSQFAASLFKLPSLQQAATLALRPLFEKLLQDILQSHWIEMT